MVHDQLDALAGGVFAKHGDIEIGIRLVEEILAVLAVSGPVFPTLVPAFDEDGRDAVLGREVYVSLHVVVVGRMTAVGTERAVVGDAGLGERVVGVCPGLAAGEHLPPHAHEFLRFDP